MIRLPTVFLTFGCWRYEASGANYRNYYYFINTKTNEIIYDENYYGYSLVTLDTSYVNITVSRNTYSGTAIAKKDCLSWKGSYDKIVSLSTPSGTTWYIPTVNTPELISSGTTKNFNANQNYCWIFI